MVEPGKASLDSLAPARRAVLVLLANQNRSYSDIAALLSTDEDDIRSRAFDAADDLLSSLASAPEEPVRRLLVDYALGQQRVSERQQTRAMLAEDAGAREWLATLESSLGLAEPEADAAIATRSVEPREPAPAPQESAPGPHEPDPAPQEPDPAPHEPDPAPREPGTGSLGLAIPPAQRFPTAVAEPRSVVSARLSGPRGYIILGTVAIVIGLLLLLVGGGGAGHP